MLKNNKVSLQPKELNVLDFGCGKCHSVNPVTWDNYDPFYRPWAFWHKSQYDIIICNYVLCTLPKEQEIIILKEIQKKLSKKGVAYISVRNDEPKGGYGISSKKTYQRKVELPYLYELRRTSQYRIYVLTHSTELPII